MKVSATEQIGVRCLMSLAEAWAEDRVMTTPEVAVREGISPQYAAKLIARLRRSGLVRSIRGVNGGVKLSKSPDKITLSDAFEALSGATIATGPCRIGKCDQPCTRIDHCGLKPIWGQLERLVGQLLVGVTIADVTIEWVEKIAESSADLQAVRETM